MIRVLIAEDSPTARTLLVGIVSSAADMVVVGEATNGADAVRMTQMLKPDIVTMDIQMPQLDGFEATQRIMSECPTPIVIISSLDVTAVKFAMEALNAGALAVLPKPAGPAAPAFDKDSRSLVATLRSMSQVKLVRRWPSTVAAPASLPVGQAGRPAAAKPRAVGIVASTGGPKALHTLFTALPEQFPIPILFVQHIALGFAEGFGRWLNDCTRIRVKVAEAGEPLLSGTAYLAPDDRHLGISDRSTVVLSASAHVGSFRPSGTFLFESMARVCGAASVGLILTGMGSDGVHGLRALRAAGGRIIAQDEATSEIFGMPAVAIAEQLVDEVLSLPRIAAELRRLADAA